MRKSIDAQAKKAQEQAAKSLSKMEIIRAYQNKKQKELWCKALGGKRTFEEAQASVGGDQIASVAQLK